MKTIYKCLMVLWLGLTGGLFAETAAIVSSGPQMTNPFAVAFDAEGNMYAANMEVHQITKVDKAGKITVIAGTGEKGDSGDGGPADKAKINGPHHLLMAPNGDLLIADTWNNKVRKIDLKTGIISTIAGTGMKGNTGDGGPADKAQTGGIFCLALDHKGGKLYLDDLDFKRIRVVDLKTGIINAVAGNGQRGLPVDGSDAKTSPLQDPRAITLDSKGNLYILERGGNALRVVGSDGRLKTVAGTGKVGPCKDGGDALKTSFNGPKHICTDNSDNVIIADAENHTVLKYLPAEGKIIRIAGVGHKGAGGIGGPLNQLELNRPHGVYVDATGTLWISDSYNNRVLKVVK